MTEFNEVISPEIMEIKRKSSENAKASTIKFVLATIFLILAGVALANADGAYNYNVTLDDANKSLAVGQIATITGYVGYNNSPVREYPCLFTVYDWTDNHTMSTQRVYTDELGQLSTSMDITDKFLYGNTYVYSVQCSNTTKLGNINIEVGETPNWFFNYFVYSNSNMNWMVILGFVLLFLIVIGLIIFRALLGR